MSNHVVIHLVSIRTAFMGIKTLKYFFFFDVDHFFFFLIYFWLCWVFVFLCEGFLQLQQARATLHRGARASHYRGLSCCGAQAPDAQAQ